MFEINIYGTPPSKEDIRELKESNSFENSVAFKVLMFTPIPGIDLLAGLATHAVEEHYFGKDFGESYGAVKQDWSESTITHSYVEKVRKQSRELLKIEVQSLNKQLSVERQAKAAASLLIDIISEKSKDAVFEIASSASGGAAAGLKSFFTSYSKQ